MLRSLLKKTWPLTFSAAALGFLCTIIVVRLFGLVVFANYTIDLAKLSLLLLMIEFVPSSYSVFHQQKDERFKNNLPSFFILVAVGISFGTFVLERLSFFSSFSDWIYLYIVSIIFQRYFDLRLQAAGRMQDFFILPLISNATRLAVLLLSTQFLLEENSISILWAALALGTSVSIIVLIIRHPQEVTPFIHVNHLEALKNIWRQRSHYYSYYPNIVLKRLRDAAMPIICDIFVADRVETGRFLLAFRGVQVVSAQLRVIEAFLNNFELRESLVEKRFLSMLIVAAIGQVAAFFASMLLVIQTSVDSVAVFAAAVASLFLYPYVAELVLRSDAYAAFTPHRVTISLLAFLAGISITIGVAMQLTELSAPVLVLAPLVGQTLASVSYLLSGRVSQTAGAN